MLSCFQKADVADVIHFGSADNVDREYLVLSPFDGFKVRVLDMQSYRMDDICVADICYIKKIAKFIQPNVQDLP